MLGNYSFSQENSFQKSIIDINDLESPTNDLFHKTNLHKCFSLISEMIKATESEFNENFPNKLKNSFIITSIFSLLNFQLKTIQQLTDLFNQTKNNNTENKKLVKNLLNLSKELIFHKIQQIFSYIQKNTNNSISYRNRERKSLKTQRAPKKLIIKINKTNNSINKDKNPNNLRIKTEATHENKNNSLYKKPINMKNNNNEYSMYTPPKKYLSKNNVTPNKIENNLSVNDLFALTESNIKKNRNLIKTSLRNYDISKSFIDSEKRKNKTIIIKKPNNKPNYNDNEENEINPIRKVKNIIINAKLHSSFSVIGNNTISIKEKDENEAINQEKKYSQNFHKDVDYYSRSGNKNIMKELMKNNKKLNSNNTAIGRIGMKEREASEIFNDCMNNVKKRLDIDEKNKTNKQMCQNKYFKIVYNKNYRNVYNKNKKNTFFKNK